MAWRVDGGCASPGRVVRWTPEQTGLDKTGKVAPKLDRLSPAAEDMAGAWIAAFGAALQARSANALSELFAEDCHWRNIFGLAWRFATISHRQPLVEELLRRAAEAGPAEFRIDAAALKPRKAVVPG
jgi:putative flavoprotein involved in K+ transport